MNKKYKNNKKFNPNQKSFYFEDYLETNYKQKKISKSLISEDRVYILFFFFFCLMTIFAIKITFVSLQAPQFLEIRKNNLNFLSLRRDVVDRNGELISRNIKAYHAAVKPNLIKDKQKFLLNIKINFPEISQEKLKNNLSKNKWFYLKKRLTEEERNKFWSFFLSRLFTFISSFSTKNALFVSHTHTHTHINQSIKNAETNER